MWSPTLRGAGGQRSLLICYADWLLSGCLSGGVCLCLCVLCTCVAAKDVYTHFKQHKQNRTDEPLSVAFYLFMPYYYKNRNSCQNNDYFKATVWNRNQNRNIY